MAKAAILEQVGSLTIGEVELAEPGPHEVLIDTKRVANANGCIGEHVGGQSGIFLAHRK